MFCLITSRLTHVGKDDEVGEVIGGGWAAGGGNIDVFVPWYMA